MGAKIDIKESDVWTYFHDHLEELKNIMHQIASCEEYGISIFLTYDAELPCIIVTADDTQLYEETAVNEHDCEETVRRIYDEYLTERVIEKFSDNEIEENGLNDLEIEEMISERENEIDCAVWDFVMDIVEGYVDSDAFSNNLDDIIDDCKEHFLEYMARKHHLPIRRPMFLEYEDGVEELSEYPYEEMEFEDEDNPIYMI